MPDGLEEFQLNSDAIPRSVAADSGIVTTGSGYSGKVVTMKRNRWSRSSGMGGHDESEQVVTIARNTQSYSNQVDIHFSRNFGHQKPARD